jgi:putative glycosyltransferase (TIGR04372 family)
MGHIYAEIGQIQRMQKLDDRYIGSKVWFLSSRKEILGDTKEIFENKKFKIFFGGIKRIFFTFVAINDPSVCIDGSIGHANYITGKNNTDFHVFDKVPRQRARLIFKDQNFYPNKDKLINFNKAKIELFQTLGIKKKYIIIQTKTFRANGTIEPLNPDLFLKTIDYFQNKDYQIVFAGREKLPKIFLNKSIIDYANSENASAINDYILVGNCSLVLASASGFCFLPESLDKPLLIINAHHISHHSGRRTIYLPTLLSRRSIPFKAATQHKYLCTYGKRSGYFTFDDMYLLHTPNTEEIYMAAKELEEMLEDNIPEYTPIQKSVRKNSGFLLSGAGLSKISNYYLINHKEFFV